MQIPHLAIDIPSGEITPLVNSLLNIIAQQQQMIESQQERIAKLEQDVTKLQEEAQSLKEQLCSAKKLKGKPKIQPSTLNQKEKKTIDLEQRPGSRKRSKKNQDLVDEERVIEPVELPEGARFNGYRQYDVQDVIIKRHSIRFLLAEYVTTEGKTIVGKLPQEYQGHYGPTLKSFILYQHHQCRVPQNLIGEQLRELGIDISTGQINRLLVEEKEAFHQEQNQVLQSGLQTAEYIHTDDTGARHQGKNGYCTVMGNDLFAHFTTTDSKSRQNYLRILRAPYTDFILNQYSRSYLIEQELAACHLSKLDFNNTIICHGDDNWSKYLENLGITSKQAVKTLTEAALLGSAIEHGLPPNLIILSDGAKQFALLSHALCWIHMERGIRRLQGVTTQQRTEIDQVLDDLWVYYRQLKDYQQQPTPEKMAPLQQRFDEIFERHYPHHYALNLAMKQFCLHKTELLRVLDAPFLPLHTNAAETDIREYVTRRKISGGTRNENGRQARDTFTGLKKTCRKLGISFWQYLLSRFKQDEIIPALADVIRTRARSPT